MKLAWLYMLAILIFYTIEMFESLPFQLMILSSIIGAYLFFIKRNILLRNLV